METPHCNRSFITFIKRVLFLVLFGVILSLLGQAANELVARVNNNSMPVVTPPDMLVILVDIEHHHHADPAEDRLLWLADRFYATFPKISMDGWPDSLQLWMGSTGLSIDGGVGFFSVGDVVFWAGTALTLIGLFLLLPALGYLLLRYVWEFAKNAMSTRT